MRFKTRKEIEEELNKSLLERDKRIDAARAKKKLAVLNKLKLQNKRLSVDYQIEKQLKKQEKLLKSKKKRQAQRDKKVKNTMRMLGF